MKKYFPIILWLCISQICVAQISNYSWHDQINGSSYDSFDHLVVMDNNDIVACGYFSGVTDFDPSGQTALLDAAYGLNFLVRYSADGVYQWAVNFDSTSYLSVKRMVKDGQGNIYMCGDFNGAADMDPSPDTLYIRTAPGDIDIWFAKYSGIDGHLVWAKSYGGINQDHPAGLSSDLNGNVYMTGSVFGTMDVDPGSGIYNITSHPGGTDGYIAKYNTNGILVSAFTIGGNNFDDAEDVVTDSANNVFVTGLFTDTVDFDPGVNVFTITPINGAQTIYILKLNNNFQFINAVAFLGTSSAFLRRMVLDKHNNLLLTGTMSIGRIDFDASPDSAFLTWPPLSTVPVFCTRQDSALHILNAFLIPVDYSGSSSILPLCITSDSYNNVYFGFDFTGDIDLDPGPGNAIYTANNNSIDFLLGKYTASGQYLWSFNLDSPSDEYPGDLVSGLDNKLYACGYFNGTIDIDPSAAQLLVTDAGSGSDGLLVCYDQCIPLTQTVSATICNGQSYIFGNDTLTSGGSFTKHFLSSSFCDSIVTLNLSVTKPVIDVCTTDSSITSNAIGATYQWMNCSNNTIVNGAVSQSFQVPDNNGYAVLVTQNGCTDTSACIHIYQNANRQIPQFEWANVMPYHQYAGNHLLRIGKKNNIYLASDITDTANFDLLGGTTHYLDGVNGHQYMCIAKYSENRNYIWSFAVGSPTSTGPYPSVRPTAMALDSEENIYVTGVYSQSFDIDPGSGIYTMSNTGTEFLAKYNSSGQFIWAVTFETLGNYFEPNCLFTDKSNHLYLGGGLSGSMNITSSSGTTVVSATAVNEALFFAQFDANSGSYLWSHIPAATQFGDNEVAGGTCDHDGNVIISGFFTSPTDFDPGAGTTILTPAVSGSNDAFLAKYTPSHQMLWAIKKNSICEDYTYYTSYTVVTDCENNIYMCGTCLNPFIDQYSPSGTYMNSFTMSGKFAYGRDLAIDENNNLYMLSNFGDSCLIGLDTLYSYSGFDDDLVFSKFHIDGRFDWSAHIGSSGIDYGNALDVDKKGNIYIAGIFEDTLDADVSSNTYNLITTYQRPFLIKYGQGCTPIDTSMISDSTHLSTIDTLSYYDWIDCSTGLIVPGQHDATLDPPTSGYYQAIIYQGNCMDTTSCHYVTSTVSIEELNGLRVSVSPNPVNRLLQITSSENIASIILVTITGTNVLEQNIKESTNHLQLRLNGISTGVYFLIVRNTKGKPHIQKLVVLP